MKTTMTTEITSTQTARMRALNDELRKDFSQGHAVMTMGVAAVGAEAVRAHAKPIEAYDNSCRQKDPYEEHDFWLVRSRGHTIFLRSCADAFPDPSSVVTKRVMTIMLAGKSPILVTAFSA